MTLAVKRYMTMGLLTVAVVIGGLGTWSVLARFDGAIVAQGRIEVDRNRQVVQHPFGGVVHSVRVDEGDAVSAGETLIELETHEIDSELSILRAQLDEAVARRNRLEAERDGRDAILFDDTLTSRPDAAIAQLVDGQRRLFDARRDNMETQVDQYRKRMDQIRDQITGVQAQENAIVRQLDLIAQELTDQRSLLDKGLAQATRVLALEREMASLEGRSGELAAAIAQSEGRITEIELAILGTEATRREDAITQLRDLDPQEIELRERIGQLQYRRDLSAITSPVSGHIYGLQVFSSSAVIQPAEPLLYIVPDDRPLVITMRIRPQDIDQLRPDQPVRLRFPNFNQKQTPELLGHVISVSGDAFDEQSSGQSFYRAEVALNDEQADRLPADAILLPGMPVEAFIQTTNRTPLQFVTKPFTDFFTRAWRES